MGWGRVVLDPKPMGVAVPLPPAALFFENKHPPHGRKKVCFGVGRVVLDPIFRENVPNSCVLHGLGAGEGAGPDLLDLPEMMHSRQFRP